MRRYPADLGSDDIDPVVVELLPEAKSGRLPLVEACRNDPSVWPDEANRLLQRRKDAAELDGDIGPPPVSALADGESDLRSGGEGLGRTELPGQLTARRDALDHDDLRPVLNGEGRRKQSDDALSEDDDGFAHPRTGREHGVQGNCANSHEAPHDRIEPRREPVSAETLDRLHRVRDMAPDAPHHVADTHVCLRPAAGVVRWRDLNDLADLGVPPSDQRV